MKYFVGLDETDLNQNKAWFRGALNHLVSKQPKNLLQKLFLPRPNLRKVFASEATCVIIRSGKEIKTFYFYEFSKSFFLRLFHSTDKVLAGPKEKMIFAKKDKYGNYYFVDKKLAKIKK